MTGSPGASLRGRSALPYGRPAHDEARATFDFPPPHRYHARMPPMFPRTACAALLLVACTEPKRDRTEPPVTDGAGSGSASGSSSSGSECVPGGPSVSVNVRDRAAGKDMPSNELGALLAWIGGFAQPCRRTPAEAPQFTLELELGPAGQPPVLSLVEREALPSLAACLEEGFAKAPAPPAHDMKVNIVIPWGCPTLDPNFEPASPQPEAAAAEPAASEPKP